MSQNPPILGELIDYFLVRAKRYDDATSDPASPVENFSTNFRTSQMAGTIAYLATQLSILNPTAGEDAAQRLIEMVEDGEALFTWCREELISRGVDVDAVSASQEATEQWLRTNLDRASPAAAASTPRSTPQIDFRYAAADRVPPIANGSASQDPPPSRP